MTRSLLSVALALPALATLATTTHAAGDGSIMYICAEERSVGWEGRSGGDVVGKFKPSEEKMFVKWHPASPDDGTPLVLPRIEVTKGSEPTETLTFAGCDFRDGAFNRKIAERGCRADMIAKWPSVYGAPDFSVSFSNDPGVRRSSITYVSFLNIIQNAYLNRGTCVLAAQ
jgi:hypothetical protein